MKALSGLGKAFKAFTRNGKAFRNRLALAELRFASTATPRLAQTAPNAIKRVAFQQPPKLIVAPTIRSGVKTGHSFAFAGRRGVPTAIPRSTNAVGLQSARNFSSTRPVFDNLAQNVQLGLRASLNGLDGVKGSPSGPGARKVDRKGKGKATAAFPTLPSHKSSPISSIPSSVSSEAEEDTESEASIDTYFSRSPEVEGVRFILPAEPTYEAASFTSCNSQRLLTRSALADLHHITQTRSLHTNRINSLVDRLELAGCLEGHHSQLQVDPFSGKKSIIISFDSTWSVSDLKQAVGWEDPWFDIVPPDDDQEMHDVTARSFVMPRPDSDVEQFLMDLDALERPFV